MNTLIIHQGSYGLKPLHVVLLIGFFTAANFVSTGLSKTTILLLFALLAFFTLWLTYWYYFRGYQDTVTIHKSNREIQITQFSLKRKQTTKSYSLDLFDRVHSYITLPVHFSGINHVEMITKDNHSGLIVCSFSPSRPKKFWSLATESENPKANALCKQIANFTAFDNVGFVGHKFTTNQVDLGDGAEFIKHIL